MLHSVIEGRQHQYIDPLAAASTSSEVDNTSAAYCCDRVRVVSSAAAYPY